MADEVDHHPHFKKEKKEKKDKDHKKEKKEKRKSKSGSRIERLSRVVKEKVHGGHSNDSTDDEAKIDTEEEESLGEEIVFDGGDEAGEHETGADGSSATKKLTLAQVKDRTLSAQAKRKRSATDGANASSLLGSFRRPGGSRLKKAEHAGSHAPAAADDEDAAPHSASHVVGDGVGDEQQIVEDDAARSSSSSSSKKKDKKKDHSSRRKRKDEKTLPMMSSRQRASLGIKINGEDIHDDNGGGEGGDHQHHASQHHKEGSSSDKRKHLTRSGSMMELNKQVNQIERQTLTARAVSRDSGVAPAKDTPTLERFVSLKNISMNLSSVFGDGGRGSAAAAAAASGSSGGGDKSPRRVSSTPEALMQAASARKMNPLWVLNQKAKQVEEEKDKREREERRKREREVLPVGDDVPEKQRQRNRVINEIINTERQYVSDLRTMLTVFRMPLDEESILTKEELGAIFSNLSMLLHINTELYDDIAKTVKETNGEELGRCFVLLADYLKMYSQYCSNQAAAREAVANATKTNPRFRAFMEKMAMNPELNGLTLRDYLIKPVQRLCKYPLLMRELIKHTEDTHADYPNLQEAFGKIEAVVTSVNEKKQADEDREVIARIISRLSNTEKFGVQLMVPGRRLVQDGKVSELAKDETVRRQFFLFTDLLILAEDLKPGSSRRKEPATWKVVSMILFAEASVLDLPDKSDQHHRIDIACKKDVTTLCFDTPEEKQEWLTSLTGKMQKLQSLSARSASSNQFDELGSASLNGVGTAAASDRFRSPSPPSGPAAFPATALSP